MKLYVGNLKDGCRFKYSCSASPIIPTRDDFNPHYFKTKNVPPIFLIPTLSNAVIAMLMLFCELVAAAV